MKIDFLTLPNGKRPAEEFFQQLDNKTLAKIYRLIERLEAEGKLTFPHVRKLEGYKGLWEIRINAQKGALRIFYIHWLHDSIILISGFIKKSQKTPLRELERARSYLKQAGINL